MKAGQTTMPILRETMLAALVLALMFLNFGHGAVAAGAAGYERQSSWCGDPLSPEPLAHAPCHACRIGQGAILPPPPMAVIAATLRIVPADYAQPDAVAVPNFFALDTQPRAPPLA